MLRAIRPVLSVLGLLLPILLPSLGAEASALPRAEGARSQAPRPEARAPAGGAATARPTAAQPAPPPAADDPWTACSRAIAAAEAGSGLPAGLLRAIALVETGRRAPGGAVEPWPWSYNAAGEGRYAASREEAIAEVQGLLARGIRSVDIGCMQVNLLHHPDAFPSLAAGFDPETNVRYAVRYLRSLHARTGDWAQATAQYHSATPERGLIYHQRVMAAMSGQGFVPGPAPGVIPLPGPAMAALCPSGRGAVLLLGARAPSLQPVVAVPDVELHLRRAAPAAPRPRIMCLRTAQARTG